MNRVPIFLVREALVCGLLISLAACSGGGEAIEQPAPDPNGGGGSTSPVITGSLLPGPDDLLVPAEGGDGTAFNDGASFYYWNKAARLKWENAGGDYLDANEIAQGPTPWAVTTVADINAEQAIEWDVTNLVQAWADGSVADRGMLLKPVGGSSGPLDYYSDEWTDPSARPVLIVSYTPSGSTTPSHEQLAASVDLTLTSSSLTVTQGQSTQLRMRENQQHVIVDFDTSALVGGTVLSAVLRLTSYAQFTNSDVDHAVFAVRTAEFDTSAPVLGLASQYPLDVGIAANPDVYYHYSFSSSDAEDGGDWLDVASGVDSGHSENRWPSTELSPAGMGPGGSTLPQVIGLQGFDDSLPFGTALCLRFKHEAGPANTQGLGNYGVSLGRKVADFPAQTISPGQTQVEELYVRMYILLGETWGENIIGEGGKRPGGISGRQTSETYAAGWGGRQTDGSNGWSARGAYFAQVPYGYNPLEGFTMFANYIYHADMTSAYGDSNAWSLSPNGLLEKGRWYCLEQQVKMNTRDGNNIVGSSGANDGLVRGWIDGRLVFERTGLRFTDMDYIGIDASDFGLYYGGPGNTPYDQQIAIDNIVVAGSYIGPMVSSTP